MFHEVVASRYDVKQGDGEPMPFGMSPTERLKLRRQMAFAAGKKNNNFFSCSWKHMALKLKKGSLPWSLSLGHRKYGQGMESRAERSLDEADS